MKEKIRVAFEKIYCIDEYDDDSLTMLGAFAVGWNAHKKETARYKKALEKAQSKLRSTQENWREQCLFEADEIMTEALKGE